MKVWGSVGAWARQHAQSVGNTVDVPLRARALGLLFLAGATIGLVSLLLPHPAKADELGLYSNVALAYLGAIGLLASASRLPGWVVHVALMVGTVLITRAVILSADPVSFYSVWFIWVGLYAFYFFSRPVAGAYVALAAGLYALTLVHLSASSPIARWLTTVATLMVAGGFIDTLVRRARADAAAAASNAAKMAKVAAVAHELAALSDNAAARAALCAAAARVTGATCVGLWEPKGDGATLRLAASVGRQPPVTEVSLTSAGAGVVSAFTTGKPLRAQLAQGHETLAPEFSDSPCHPGARVWQPIMQEQSAIGVLALSWDEPQAIEDPSLLTVIDLIASEVTVTLDRISLLGRLEAIARTDELTGLPNRRAWHEDLPRELSRAARVGEPVCVAMLDLDHFKQYNDRRGHQAGDRLLKEVAGAWTSELRATDILARYGGEEFALVLPSCSLPRALIVVERLREVTPAGQSCSAGVALWDGFESASELVGRADGALYHAKRTGRDRTVIAQEGSAAGLDSARGV